MYLRLPKCHDITFEIRLMHSEILCLCENIIFFFFVYSFCWPYAYVEDTAKSHDISGGLITPKIRILSTMAPRFRYLSHCRSVQLAMIHNETIKTSSTVPGQMVIRVLSTKRVLKLIRFRAPMLRELASVNSLEWRSITLEREKVAQSIDFHMISGVFLCFCFVRTICYSKWLIYIKMQYLQLFTIISSYCKALYDMICHM